MATTLTRTIGTPTSQKISTLSWWMKRSVKTGLGSGSTRIVQYQSAPTYFSIYLDDRSAQANWSRLRIHLDDTQSPQYVVGTKMRFKDQAGWYHCVVRIDTTQSSAGDRVRVYVNGEQQTLGGLSDEGNQPAQDYSIPGYASGQTTTIGNLSNGGMYLSEMIFADGQSYAPTVFGSSNSNGAWIPNNSPSVTYGNNGYRLSFGGTGASADANGFGADTSGNGNHFASANLGTNPSVTDTPENNFCTLDADQGQFVAVNTFSEGNLKITTDGSGSYSFVNSTMGIRTGKWYWEMKAVSKSGGNDWYGTGVMVSTVQGSNDYGGGDQGASNASGCYYYGYGQIRVNGTTPGTYASYTAGDIVSVAMDCDNEAIYFAKNGVWQNSGVPTSGASKTGAQTLTTPEVRSSGYNFWVPGVCGFDGSNDFTMQINFGNPSFTIASSNSDANGYGSFEYAVPSGYYAICSKNLGQY